MINWLRLRRGWVGRGGGGWAGSCWGGLVAQDVSGCQPSSASPASTQRRQRLAGAGRQLRSTGQRAHRPAALPRQKRQDFGVAQVGKIHDFGGAGGAVAAGSGGRHGGPGLGAGLRNGDAGESGHAAKVGFGRKQWALAVTFGLLLLERPRDPVSAPVIEAARVPGRGRHAGAP